MSHNQKAIWLLQQIEPESTAFHVGFTLHIRSALNVRLLQQAVCQVVQRHANLRTVYQLVGDEPQRVIQPTHAPDFAHCDATGWSAAMLTARMSESLHRPFDLAERVLRVSLYSLADDHHVLHVVMHHIAVDGWSGSLIIHELSTLYEALLAKVTPPLPNLPYQYDDFVAWQADLLAGDRGQTMRQFWQNQLAGEQPKLALPGDLPSASKEPHKQTFNAATYHFRIGAQLTQALRRLALAEGSTLHSLLIAAFQIFLYRYSGQQCIQIGTPVLGRSGTKFARVVGNFTNVAVIRGEIDPAKPFRCQLQQTKATIQAALANQHYPYSLLMNDRNSSGGAFYHAIQASLNLLKLPRHLRALTAVFHNESGAASVKFGGFTVSGFDIETGHGIGQVDLNLDLYDLGDTLPAVVTYNGALFSEATMQRMMNHFLTLLHSIAVNSDQTAATLPLLTAAEQHQLLVAWNQTNQPFPSTALLHQRFAAQAKSTPANIAVVHNDKSVTYAQLDRQANQLAHYLRRFGVGPETLVGVSLTRSSNMIIALLGILKVGAAYLPLDPNYPAERLTFMLADAQPRLVLTEQALIDRLPCHQDSGAPILVRLDTDWPHIAGEAVDEPATAVTVENLAYVIYTSGSTGQPKGVMITHGAVANYCHVVIEQFCLSQSDRVWQFTTINFDAAVEEIFPTLLKGATLVLRGQEIPPVADLCQLVDQAQLTVLDLPTAYWHEWVCALAAGEEALPASLRLVVVGGEQVSAERYRTWQTIAGANAITWLNSYGPTETTVVALIFVPDGVERTEIPLGRPIANSQVYILDANQQPVPIGVPGELYIGGAGVARGYLKRPALTAERFIVSPFAAHPPADGQRPLLYRTGDRAYYLPDGNIAFLGRNDSQVKIRGFRVELGEIEKALAQHPAVADCVVTVHDDEPATGKQLVAYVVRHAADAGITAVALRQQLRTRLPHYMVPAAFVFLPAIPRSINQKIDRQALPAPTQATVHDRIQRTTMSETEALVARIWEDVLHTKNVGPADNFFDLGGHSLLATQVVSRIKKATGVAISLRILFEEPTVANVAAAIAREQSLNPLLLLPPLEPMARTTPIPLSFAQERMWFLQQLAPDNSAYHISLVVRLSGELNVAALAGALAALSDRHESLRTIFPIRDGVPQQVILPNYDVSIAKIDLTKIAVSEQETIALQQINADLSQPFDLGRKPAWRATLFTLERDTYILYFAFHHIIFDQWSSAILWQDLIEYYTAFVQQRRPTLAPATIQYADFAIWQRTWLQGEALERVLAYWREQLAGVPVLNLPLDKPRPPVQTFRGATEFLPIPLGLAQKLQAASRQHQVSPFMLMMAAFTMLLAHYTGQKDIAIGVPVANRHHLDVESLIGTLVNTLVIRTDLTGEPNFADLLVRVRNVLLGAYAHQDLPFEKLVNEIVTKRDLSHTPLVQILFNMVNTPFAYERLADLPISLVQFDRGAAQFDLAVTVAIDEHLPLDPQIAVEYNVDLFHQATIQRLLAHYQTLLEAVVADSNQPIAHYSMLSQEEKQQLLVDWNRTAMAYPRQLCLPDLVTRQAQRTPQATAVTYGHNSLTYQELEERANQLAHHLQKLGIGPEMVVGLFVERSLEMIVGLLGILKAGGAYLPLDPAFPAERLAFMLDDAHVHVVLTQEDLVHLAPAVTDGHLLCLDTDWWQIATYPKTLPTTAVQPENLAYLIYTSGSTGKPKGVQIEHRNVVNFLTAMQQQPGMGADDILLAVTTLSFDISILELFLPLVSGAQVVIADRLTTVDGRELLKAMRRYAITMMQATPTTWSMLIEAGWQTNHHLRTVLCGGEALSHPLAEAILTRGVALWNMYGPTETTIWSTAWRVASGEGPIPIGRPIGNNQLYILDELGRPAPIGVAGELYIGGDGVARGYLNRPALNAQRFVHNPFVTTATANRLYRTGDSARYRADGTVDYLGRLDFQVKVNGHRIELGEIETILATHSAVQEAIVTVYENALHDQQLIAYMVLHEQEEDAPTVMGWRNYLRRQLPDYMVPTNFIYLDAFPLTPNRKIDRKSLPAPDNYRPDLASQYVAPRNDLEKLLATIVAELLDLEKVGVYDDFFALGGHSLQATRFAARVGKALRVEIPLWAFLGAPSVAALAEYLLSLSADGASMLRIAQLQLKMASLSDEEVRRLLQVKRQKSLTMGPVRSTA